MKELMEKYGSSSGPNQIVEEIKEVVKEEVKAPEKKFFDVELTGIEASKKLNIIKEFKNLFSLGLKEAKDTVEKPPVVLKKGALKEEANELKMKLEALGCIINLK